MHKISKLAVLTSGGDAPGMNPCIRSIVRTAIYNGLEVVGIRRGYQGLIEDDMFPMGTRSVSNILNLGGTILKTARCLPFRTDEGQEIAYQNLKKRGIDALVVIGGDGTFTGALRFSKSYPDVAVMGVPGTIDNDLYGSTYTLGFDTATNTVIEAIDKIRDTADAHDRLFFIEVMGRDSGAIALRAGISCGAEAILLPEKETAIDDLIENLKSGQSKKKSSSIVIVAEGDKHGGAYDIAKLVEKQVKNYDIKVTILGHLQRGGSPSAFDRVLGSRLGFAAVNALIAGKTQMMVGLEANYIKITSLEEALTQHEFKLEEDLMKMAEILSI
ncbi:6-phosphofructokinase [Mucilaginibacter gotjawali]|jgi:6-phosphofructokinase 1|uniref:ATP-dependent 6-phosphofructokinase n=2 Tax=Mucilaginibacter gotjawali TaxID=1550579 RepID=A0A0X8X028_9SPHI|nr:6-phosphofructokinase [Mucilaginibacter gotjawali]MBB3055335.1 6-phosphofructokinase 1 [Mucilaginibacter gotjawali]BAU53389.1 6-phosphofructokinase isozyme 1 [Mucilaginibacter gotjawali]